ncbi:MAG: diacylglycerol kinase family lipid kinase [Muribaculaceae bacterium]|nr:diacylglycerol kinase family lipid kinase [Muribaculaceae bacterium]
MIVKKILAIINPISGTSKKNNIPQKINDILSSEDVTIDIVYTEYAGHATVLAQKAVEDGYNVVLAIGGDGTCNEVAKALINTRTALGIIPTGSGNGLARHLGIPIGITAALKSLKKSHMVRADFCTANDIPFFVTCGFGFDAQISEKFSKSKTRGGITYVEKSLEEYFNYTDEEYIIETESSYSKEKAFIIACGNVSQYGNNAFIAPYASLRDGLIDVTIINHIKFFEVLPTAIQLFTKTLNRNPSVKTFCTSEVVITRSKAGIMHIDGEPIEMPEKIKIKCHKRGLRIMVPDIQAANQFEADFLNMLSTVFGIRIPKKI